MRAACVLSVLLVWPWLPGFGQERETKAEALQWSIALSGRFRDLRDPVVAAAAMANLGALVCAQDRVAGFALFQDALSRLRLLTPDSFRLPNHLLPVSSFTELWSGMTGAAAKCDRALEEFNDAERAYEKMALERQQANDTLERGILLIDSQPDRAAQLAESALHVSAPSILDADRLMEFLSQLRDRAPDLADDVFNEAIDFVTATSADGRLVSPASAYALAVRMLDDVDEDVPLELIDELQKTIQRLYAQIGGAHAASILLELALPAPDLRPVLERVRPGSLRAAIDRVFQAIRAKNFAGARGLARDLPFGGSGEITSLINFAESAAAIERKDLSTALNVANLLEPGVKRVLLYAAISAAASDRESAFGPLQLAFKDIEAMPAEFRMLTLSAVANAALRKDPESGYLALSELVKASNDAFRRPRRAFFDPAAARRAFRGRAAPGTDTSLILVSKRCICEVIDTGSGRIYFGLRGAGADALSLLAVVRNATGADPLRLEAIILSLQSERQMAQTLNALAEMRLNK